MQHKYDALCPALNRNRCNPEITPTNAHFIPAHVEDGTGPGLVVIQRLGMKTSLQTDGNQRLTRAASHSL